MKFIDVPEERYEDYRYLFDKDYCSKSFVDSAFTFKMYPLKVDDLDKPKAAFLDFRFAIIYSGEVKSLSREELMSILPARKIVAGDRELWKSKMLEFFEGNVIERRRTIMSHQNLSLEKLENLKKPLPEGYTVGRIDKETAENLPEILGMHIPILYSSLNNFMEKGIGFIVKNGEVPVSLATSTVPYTSLLDVQISTVDSTEYRRKGFGTVACIALLEYCLKNNIEPIWEAANDRSVAMALKLGYTNPVDIFHYYWKQ